MRCFAPSDTALATGVEGVYGDAGGLLSESEG